MVTDPLSRKTTGSPAPEQSAAAFFLPDGTALRAAYLAVRDMLTAAAIDDAAFDAAQLVRHVTGLDYRVQPDAALTAIQAESLCALAARRAGREPLQYLLGAWDFLDFTLAVGPGVLIPRADTEIVCQTAIEAAQAALQSRQAACVLDLCAGSGAIAIGVARAVPQAAVTAVELSEDALPYLYKNAAALAPALTVAAADVFAFQAQGQAGSVDVLVSNPPYITHAEMATLAPELGFEPKMALEAPENGLAFYHHIAAAYRPLLKQGAAVVFEIGSTQAADVVDILRKNEYCQIAVLQDAAGNDRCVRAIAL